MKIKLALEINNKYCIYYPKREECATEIKNCNQTLSLCCFECNKICECNDACQLDFYHDERIVKFIKYEEVK